MSWVRESIRSIYVISESRRVENNNMLCYNIISEAVDPDTPKRLRTSMFDLLFVVVVVVVSVRGAIERNILIMNDTCRRPREFGSRRRH